MGCRQSAKIKRGDSFAARCTVIGSDGEPINLGAADGVMIVSQIRNGDGGLVQQLVIQKLDQAAACGQYMATATPLETAVWPVDDLLWDIEYTLESGLKTSTDTITLRVIEDITHV